MTTPAFTNPYVGPRAFETKDSQFFFGRPQEVIDLLDLLIAERIVLLYSPSGAGKSSLIQAGLIPQLAGEGFIVLPVMRVSREMQVDFALPETFNPYIFSALLSLEGSLSPERQIPLPELAALDLDAYLNRQEARLETAGSIVLIFDQFEEILTHDPMNRAAKAIFFSQVGEALRNPNRWALFSLREDYIAGLDAYLRFIPTRLNTTFRLELLGKNAARQAMQDPAKVQGVDFTNEAAQQLVDDLARVSVQQRDGQIIDQAGNFVEPVQLQVVCHRLWQRKFPSSQPLPPGQARIEANDIESVGDVDSALAGYYADRVKAIAAETGVSERIIRNWCDTALIVTPQNIRGQVIRGIGQSQGLDNRAIERLVNAHLVRAEDRRGVTWYELAHDRLIKPIKDDNAEWQQKNLAMLQREAALWNERGQPDGLLLRDKTLQKAERWAEAHKNEVGPLEDKYLEESRREQRRRRFMHWMFLAMGIVTIIAVAAMIIALVFANQTRNAKAEAEQQKSTAIAALDAVATAQVAAKVAVEKQQTAEAASTALALAGSSGTPNIARQQTATVAAEEALIAQVQAEAELDKANQTVAQSLAALPPTETPTISPTPSATTTPTETPTSIPTGTPTSTPTFTPTPSPTNTLMPTPNQTATAIAAAQTRQARLDATATAQAKLLSPPPGRIIFTSNRFSSTDLYSMKSDGSDLLRLTTEGGWDPDYSPDSKKIVFVSKRNNRTSLFTIDPSGRDEIPIGGRSESDKESWEPAFSPIDGRVAFVSSAATTVGIYQMSLDGTFSPRLLTEDQSTGHWAPAWSPDGKTIAFVSQRDAPNGQPEIWLMDSDGSNTIRLTENDSIDTSPAWSPDGQKIAFTSNRDGSKDIFIMNRDGSEQRNVTHSPFDEDYPTWSFYGNWLAFSRFIEENNIDIIIMAVEGEQEKNLTKGEASNWAPEWLPCLSGTPSNFDAIWRNHLDLGCPVPPVSVGGLLSWQPFERGDVFFSGELNIYLVSFEDGTWQKVRDGDIQPTNCPDDQLPTGYSVPDGGIGRLWCDTSGIGKRLGFAKQRLDQGNGFQQFENGYIWRNELGGTPDLTFFVFFGQNSGKYIRE